MKIVYCVTHHPARADYLPILKERLGFPRIIQIDCDGEGNWPNHKSLLNTLAGTPFTHAVIVQDDVYPVDDFPAHIEGAITANPDQLFSLYLAEKYSNNGRKLPEVQSGAYRRGLSWCLNSWFTCVGLVWPVPLIVDFLEWIDGRDAPDNEKFWGDMPKTYSRVRDMDDVRMWRWAKARRQKVRTTVPSLVEHMGNGVSLLKIEGTDRYRNTESHAQVFHKQLPKIDWSKGL